MKPTLLVLAAGMGSRYGGVKQIDPVGPSGEAIIDYSVYDAIEAGFDRVVFVVREAIREDVQQFFHGKFEGRIELSFVNQDLQDVPASFAVPPERTKPWGTAQAVLAARNVIKAPFAVINGDDFYGRPALVAMAEYLSTIPVDSTDYAVVGYRLDSTLSEHGTVSRGIISRDQEGWMTSIREHTRLAWEQGGGAEHPVASLDGQSQVFARFTGSEPVSMNLFGFSPVAMSQMLDQFSRFLTEQGTDPTAEFYIPYGVSRLLQAAKARMKVLDSDSQWFGVTYQEDRPYVVAQLAALTEQGVYPSPLWK